MKKCEYRGITLVPTLFSDVELNARRDGVIKAPLWHNGFIRSR